MIITQLLAKKLEELQAIPIDCGFCISCLNQDSLGKTPAILWLEHDLIWAETVYKSICILLCDACAHEPDLKQARENLKVVMLEMDASMQFIDVVD